VTLVETQTFVKDESSFQNNSFEERKILRIKNREMYSTIDGNSYIENMAIIGTE
jgi:hypothetical protein